MLTIYSNEHNKLLSVFNNFVLESKHTLVKEFTNTSVIPLYQEEENGFSVI